MNTQDKFTAALYALAKRKRCELVNDRGWSNTGVFRFQRIGEFGDLLTARYSFQLDYASFTLAKSERCNIIEFPHTSADGLQEVLDTIDQNLEAQTYED